MSRYVFVKINDDITSIKRLKEMFPNITEEDFKDILESDPTYANGDIEAGKYGRWLLSLFNKNNLKKEDLYKAKEYLEKFDKLKNKISNKDINAYKTLPDLYKTIEEIESKSPTKSELKRNVQRTDLDKDAKLFMETENFKIYIPLTYEASCKLGNNTQWCTATRSDREYYDMYIEDNNKLYIIISKNDPSEKYQWNTKERYTCDRKDEEISEITLCRHYPDLIKFFTKFGYDNIENLIKEVEEYRDGKEYIYNGKEIDEDIKIYIKKAKISNGIAKISTRAFAECKSLESIEIPNSVTSIGYEAFNNCISLKSIELPNSVENIEFSAFKNCKSLRTIKLSNHLTIIRLYTFAGCESLTNIELPKDVKFIDSFAFHGCRSLTSIEIPNSVDHIDSTAFSQCSSNLVIKTKNLYVIEYCKKNRLRYSEE